jgi:hypothetical protein
MGKCETATASIGIKILLSDLISQLNETTFDIIQDMLYDGFIEDENNKYNDEYVDVVKGDPFTGNYIEYKEYLLTELKKNGCLDKALLLPVREILQTDRWGYDRSGTNGISRPIDFDLSVSIEKYKDIEHIQIVFIIKQHSG